MAQVSDAGEVYPVRGWRWRKVKPCGTTAAWRRHQRRGEPIDERCRAAHTVDMTRRRPCPSCGQRPVLVNGGRRHCPRCGWRSRRRARIAL